VLKIKYFLLDLLNNIFNELKIKQHPELRISNVDGFDMQLNNLLRMRNESLKEKLINEIKNIESHTWIEKIEFTDSGFINFRYSNEYVLDFIMNTSDNFKEIIYSENPESYLLDYGGMNIGKEMHVGHIRSLNIGRGIKNLLLAAGHEVISDIHLGDWGMPVAQILNYCYKNELDIKNISINDLEEIYPIASEMSKVNKEFFESSQNINKKLNSKDPSTYNDWKHIYKISTDKIKKTLSIFNHDFDIFEGESDANDYIGPLIKSLMREKLIHEDEGAYITSIEDKNILITKSDGSYLYITTDLGTVVRREEKHNIDKYIYIVDQRQKQHFENLFKCIKKFELSDSEFLHIGYGTINNKDGRPLKTRDGGSYKLRDLYKDIERKFKNNIEKENDLKNLTNSVLTYSDLQTNKNTDYKFDLDKFTSTEGNTAVYLQYTFARSNKVLQEYTINTKNIILPKTQNKTDQLLMREIIKLPEKFKLSVSTLELNHLADYAFELSKVFNKFYSNNKIINTDSELMTFRLQLTKQTNDTLKFIFNVLGIEAVEKL
tara:strand:- start:157 stop:1797 length:1641 start_codon:yes stop_codon:yes gene_type:complete